MNPSSHSACIFNENLIISCLCKYRITVIIILFVNSSSIINLIYCANKSFIIYYALWVYLSFSVLSQNVYNIQSQLMKVNLVDCVLPCPHVSHFLQFTYHLSNILIVRKVNQLNLFLQIMQGWKMFHNDPSLIEPAAQWQSTRLLIVRLRV